ncbi:hypothetical protein D3C71_451730 [compost metagenome]
MIDWKTIDTAPTERPRNPRDRYLIASFPKGAIAVGHMHRLDRDAFTTLDGQFHAPTHWAEINEPDNEDATDWVAEAKSMEQAFMVAKDEYSSLARAIGIKGDSWFGDPLESHDEVVQRAKSVIALLKDAELALQPFAHFSEIYPDAESDLGIISIHDGRCPVTVGDTHAALSALQAIRKLTGFVEE